MFFVFSPISVSRKNNRLNQANIFFNIEPPTFRHSSHSHSDEATFEEAKENQRRNHLKDFPHMKDTLRGDTGDFYKKQQNRDLPEQKEHLKLRNFNDTRDVYKGDNFRETKQDYRLIFFLFFFIYAGLL